VLAALSTRNVRAQPGLEPGDSNAPSSATIVVGRWWRVFRLALLLAVALGLALATWIKRRRSRIAAAVCVSLLVAVIWPIGVFLALPMGDVAQRLAAASPLWAAEHLMDPLINRQPHPAELVWWIASWDVVVMLFAIGVFYLALLTESRPGTGRERRIATDHGASLEPSLVEARVSMH